MSDSAPATGANGKPFEDEDDDEDENEERPTANR